MVPIFVNGNHCDPRAETTFCIKFTIDSGKPCFGDQEWWSMVVILLEHPSSMSPIEDYPSSQLEWWCKRSRSNDVLGATNIISWFGGDTLQEFQTRGVSLLLDTSFWWLSRFTRNVKSLNMYYPWYKMNVILIFSRTVRTEQSII